MFGFGKKQSYLIGVDLGNDCLKLAQLANGTEETYLMAGQYVSRPADITPGTARWQRWAIEVMREATARRTLQGQGRRRGPARQRGLHRPPEMAEEIRRQDRRRSLCQGQAEAAVRADREEHDDQVHSGGAGQSDRAGDGADRDRPSSGDLRAGGSGDQFDRRLAGAPWRSATPGSSAAARRTSTPSSCCSTFSRTAPTW